MPKLHLVPISEEAVQATAAILGPHSASAQALKDAERRRAAGEEVRFFKAGPSLVVQGTAQGACGSLPHPTGSETSP